ncbi:ribosomal protein S18-alanine N-acetyltransferase [Botrimarina sp.]|uniref:ribosomal protein S18-alanine N-acetyltransferase n=1 Tax=Botrimarina sp. TaxID=2795802 RepID=UPI0032EDD52E
MATTESRTRLDVHIRWMIRRDMPQVLEIEQSAFEFPWSEEDFIACLRQRNCIGMVAEGCPTPGQGERVVGFMIYELHKTRLHLLNFAVSKAARRSGVGTQMVEKLIGKLSSQRRTRLSLEVRETNLPAQIFFRAAGFKATSVLRDFYDDSPEDAYLMQYYHRSAEDAFAADAPLRRLAG